MGDEKLMFDLHVIAVLRDHSPCPSAGVAQTPGRLPRRRSSTSTPLHLWSQLQAAAGHVLPHRCWRAIAWRFQLRFWLVNSRTLQAGMESLLEVWGWQLLGMGLPARAPAASKEDQHRVPAWQVPVPL